MKRPILSALSLAGAGLLLNRIREKYARRLPLAPHRLSPMTTRTTGIEDAVKKYTLYLIMPAWICSSLIDYFLHRREKIETTSGVAESAMHSLLLAEGAVPTIAGLFLDVNAGVLATMIAGFIAHQATAMWDVFFTAKRRRIGPIEQHTHSGLELLPFCALSLTMCLHFDQLQSLLRMNGQSPDFRLRLKRDPLPAAYVALVLGATGGVGALYAEELWRCANAARRQLTGVDTPRAAQELFGTTDSVRN